MSEIEEFARRCVDALASKSTYPGLSKALPDADLITAYRTQAAFVKARSEDIVGYKAAVTAAPAQQAMGLDAPALGVLLTSTEKSSTVPAPTSGILETELGYYVHADISTPVTAESVASCLSAPICVVEIACPNLEGRPTGIDLIATNTATWGFLKGEILAAQEVDAIQTSLSLADSKLFSGTAGDILAGQMSSAAWLVNQALELGYPVLEGHFLMTGSIGGVAPTKPGEYMARYRNNSVSAEIAFTLT